MTPKSTVLIIVEGSSDDLDLPIKNVLSDEEFSSKHHLFSINSINWGRILMQTVHSVYSYFFALKKTGVVNFDQQVEIAFPTGACGNITGMLHLIRIAVLIFNCMPIDEDEDDLI